MILVDEIEVLRRKIDQIEPKSEDIKGSVSLIRAVDFIETAFWARSVLEIIACVQFNKYGHTLKKSIRTVNIVPDPDHPGNYKTVYEHNNTISLKKLLDAIVHFRYFESSPYADDKKCLEVQSDRNTIHRVYFWDFIKTLKSLVISRRLVALAICDFVEQKITEMLLKPPHDLRDIDIFCLINLNWVLRDFLKDEVKLKLEIMKEVFGIANVPSEVLCGLTFFINGTMGDKLKIGFDTGWEDEQKQKRFIDRTALFDLIRRFYATS